MSDLFHLSNYCSGSYLFILCFVPVQTSASLAVIRPCSYSSLVKISTTEIFAACSPMSVLCVAVSHIIYQKEDCYLILLKKSSVWLLLQKKRISKKKPFSNWNTWHWPEVKSDSIILRKSVQNTFVPLCSLSIYMLCNNEMPLAVTSGSWS